MLSYVFMKMLEARPKRYDRCLAWLSLGQSDRVKRRIINEHVAPGVRMLEIGVGTGTLALMAARKGARVFGFDISENMLRIARSKAAAAKLDGNIELRAMGVGGMDTFEDGCFDLAVATLLFSELTPDEQIYALRHVWRVLRPGGKMVVADEVKPRRAGKRLLHALVRTPLAAAAYAFTQCTSRPVTGIGRLAEEAGFTLEQAERSAMDSFLYLVARKD